jgi:uncharacterized membrane protein YhfC
VVVWHFRRRFTRWALIGSLVAYSAAIAAKALLQFATIGPVEAASAGDPAVLGAYLGAQTAAFEVGGAFLAAWVAVEIGRFGSEDAAAFGLGLAFWENGVLIALPLLLDYSVYYAVLSHPGSAAAIALYPVLRTNSPALFDPPATALPLIGYAVLERVSSLLAHFSWGLLAVLAAVRRKWYYLTLAAPIGFLVDFLVPFEDRLGLGVFELLTFAIALGGFGATLVLVRATPGPAPSRPPADGRPGGG